MIQDLNDLFAVGADDHGVQMPRVINKMAECAERQVAAAAEGVEDRTLSVYGEGYDRIVERGDGVVGRGVVCGVRTSSFESERPLSGCGAEFVDGEALVDVRGAIETIEARSGENESIGLTFLPLAEASVDVAAELDKAEVRAKGEEHGLTARRSSADACVARKHVETPEALAYEGIASVGSRGDGGESETRIELRGEIFERVDGNVNAVGGEGVFDLLDEDSFCIDWGAIVEGGGSAEGGVLHAVAGGADDFDGDLVAKGAELIGDVVGLPEREFGAAGADAKGWSAHRD